MTSHEEIAAAIIEGQSVVMGQVAYAMANKVPAIEASPGAVRISGDGNAALDALVREYSALTGPLGVRMCFNAAQPVLGRFPDVKVSAFSGLG